MTFISGIYYLYNSNQSLGSCIIQQSRGLELGFLNKKNKKNINYKITNIFLMKNKKGYSMNLSRDNLEGV